MPGKGKAQKSKKQEKKKDTSKKMPKAQKGSGGTRTLVSNRRYPVTYFSTEKGGEGEMIIKGHEIIGEVSTSANYVNLIDELLTPLNAKLFPKLSAIARTFEQYRFRRLRFHFRTGCNATVAGSIMHYIEYSVNDPPAVDAIVLLANQNAMVSSVTLDNSVEYEINRQMLAKMFTGQSSPNFNAQNGSPRENYIGNYRLFMDKGAATAVFAGYVYAEYECCFWTPRPPVPVGGAGTIKQTITLGPSNPNGIPLPAIEENVGLPGQQTVGNTTTYTNFGGLPGALDYARNVYESGKWILSALGNLSAAAMSHGEKQPRRNALSRPAERDDLSVRSFATERSYVHDYREEKTSSVGPGQPASGIMPIVDWDGGVEIAYNDLPGPPFLRKDGSPLASGDVTWYIQWFDVTNGYVNPDFPADATNMVAAGSTSISYLGSTSAVNPNLVTQMIVPDGKRYMARVVPVTGATTSRTMSFLQFTSQCQTHFAG